MAKNSPKNSTTAHKDGEYTAQDITVLKGLDPASSEVTRIYELLLDALDFISVTHNRLQSVVNEFKNAEDAFAGTETFTLTQS